MTVWSALVTFAIGAAVGGCAVWFQLEAGVERRVQMARDARAARLRAGGVRFAAPRSHCRRLDEEASS